MIVKQNISTALLPVISRLKLLAPGTSEKMRKEIEKAHLDWKKFSYTEYVSEGVFSLSLLNSDGDSNNTIIRDCIPKPTDVLEQLPATKRFLAECGLDLMWARLNRLESGASLWEHKDYSELEDKNRLRIHLPIKTNKRAWLILSGHRIHLHEDALWKLNPASVVHGAINEGSTRIHLILDCYINEKLKNLLKAQQILEQWFEELKIPSEADYNKKLIDALTIYHQTNKKEAEKLLLKTFYYFEQPEGTSLELVKRMYQLLGWQDEANVWEERKHRFLHQESLKILLDRR
ncbi:MAG: aspartyl/asparaginyl beta-hydroxylase domain-containing protein [Xenococcaceae cyanobacterium MO_207.B15]|nr:aspartyl/asparaginyl beta-hydroxylase domain-containing protein [Xenococcaceae cyanobacterium MO_207.B15]